MFNYLGGVTVRSRRRAAAITRTLALALLPAAAITLASAPSAFAAGYPGACDQFQITYIQRDNGAGLEWVLAHQCYMGPDIPEVVVTTYQDGVVRDVRHIPTGGGKFVGRTTGYVLLPPRPVCSASLIRVEATYKYLSTGDDTSTEGTLYFDPNDNC